MSSPTSRDADALKHLARYLLGRPRLVMNFGWQDALTAFVVFTDTDWAGCVRARKSTSGGVALRGTRVLRAWCSRQAIVSLSSAEAQLISLARGAAEELGIRSLAADFSHEYGLRIRGFFSGDWHVPPHGSWRGAAFGHPTLVGPGVGARSGAGGGEGRRGGDPADLLTKHLEAELISAHSARMSFLERVGRALLPPSCT